MKNDLKNFPSNGGSKMLIEERFDLVLNNMNIRHYRSIGFVGKMGDTIQITTSQLSKGSHNKVWIQCDYCPEKFERVYKDYLKFKGKAVDKDACVKCRPIKTKENNLVNYGVESIRHVKEVNDKIEATNLERYGSTNPMMNKDIRKKASETLMKNHGVDNYFKVENFHDIQKDAMMQKYGYERYSDDPIKLSEANRKRNITMYKNGTAPTSRQQKYFHDIVGGELNYPYGSLMLDIGFPNEKIYLEYQGSGHDLDVSMGKMTAEVFNKKDINRYYFMKKQGWRMIEVISKKDTLPNKQKTIEMMILAREHLNSSSYIVFDLDKNQIKINGEFILYDFGEVMMEWTFRKHHEKETYKNII
jgi:hypothetical protein